MARNDAHFSKEKPANKQNHEPTGVVGLPEEILDLKADHGHIEKETNPQAAKRLPGTKLRRRSS